FLSGVDTIEVVDNKTIKITLTQPDASFLIKINGRYSGAMDIYPKRYLDIGIPWADNEEALWNPIGSGPYKFKEYIEAAEVRLEAFPDWWGGKPGFDEVIFKIIPDITLAQSAFDAGEVDFLNQFTSFAEYKRMAAKPEVESAVRFSYMEALEFNVLRPPFDDVNVRKAICYAINRTELNEKIYLGLGSVPENPYFPSWMEWTVNPDVKAFPYDPEMAKTLLDAAGLEPDANGVRFSMSLAYARP
ncbi:MAG: ABC transporter substrate-binding protein, partial [Candidatus Hydrothermarchaeales archaeon]